MKTFFKKYKWFIAIFCITSFLGVGYSQITDVDLLIDGTALAEGQTGIVISDIEYQNGYNASDKMEINTYYQSMFHANIELGSTANNYVTAQVKITNLTNEAQLFDGYFYDIEFYSNTNIVPTLNGIAENTTILEPSQEITFTITFQYLDSSNITNQELDAMVNFHFTPMVKITMQNCTNASGETEEKIRKTTYTNMSGTEYKPIINLGSTPPTSISIQNTDGSITLTENTDYTYQNGVVTFLIDLEEEYTIVADNSTTGDNFATYILDIIKDVTPDSNSIYTGVAGNNCTNTFAYDGTSDNNLRYVGKNPCNYVKFNCDDNLENCETWRILGVLKDVTSETNVKMVKSSLDYSGTQWHSSAQNIWLSSTLYNTLNTTYYNGLNTKYGKDLIENVNWNIGGIESNFTSANFYTNEHEEKSSTPFKIGLFSPADYGYATSGNTSSRSSCIAAQLSNGTGYSQANCRNYNWLYTNQSYQWTMIRKPSSANNQVYYITSAGLSSYAIVTSSSSYYNYRPCIYLKHNIKVIDGDGSETNPYVISE